jgi:hypothetical protein
MLPESIHPRLDCTMGSPQAGDTDLKAGNSRPFDSAQPSCGVPNASALAATFLGLIHRLPHDTEVAPVRKLEHRLTQLGHARAAPNCCMNAAYVG